MGPLSCQKRGEIVAAFKEAANVSLVARQCGVSRATARRWLQRSQTTGDVLPLKSSGRKPGLSAAAATRAVELLTEQPGHTTSQAAKTLAAEGLTTKPLHRTTVARAAKQAAKESGDSIRCVTGRPAKRLTNATKKKRLYFAKSNKRRQWASVLFTDRKTFLWHHPGARAGRSQWVKRGEKRTAVTVNHPLAVNVYLGICKRGCTPCKTIAGTSKYKSPFTNKKGKPAKNVTTQVYADVLTSTFLPSGNKLFSEAGITSWFLQQDNDPAHRVAAEIVKQHSQGHSARVEVLANWPPNSPDLNPIENLWGILEAEVAAKQCDTFEEFQDAVVHACSHVPKPTLCKLIGSMPKRIAQVLQNGGDMTKY
jgi:transposase